MMLLYVIMHHQNLYKAETLGGQPCRRQDAGKEVRDLVVDVKQIYDL